MAEQALGAAGCRLSEVELLAVANGPGSFTGIRVGVAAAQGWAKAFQRPVQGVSVLEAMTEAAQPPTEWAAALLDARRGEFYLGLSRRSDAHGAGARGFAPHGPGRVLKPPALGAFLEEQLPTPARLTCLVHQHDAAAARLRASLPKRFAWQSLPDLLLAPIARLALAAHRQGRVQSPADLDACYIRRTDAELHWQE
jgi:tRNA threonylcarbamoyladenosine biosynthesis protein TsaB